VVVNPESKTIAVNLKQSAPLPAARHIGVAKKKH
jgi:hypothetical protein